MSSDETGGRDIGGGLAPAVWFVLLVAAAWVVPNSPASALVVCPSKWIFSIDCPGCGMTRSVTAFVRGRWQEALEYHAAGPILVIGLGWIGALRAADKLAKRKVLSTLRMGWQRVSTPVWWTALVVLLVYWVVRLAGG